MTSLKTFYRNFSFRLRLTSAWASLLNLILIFSLSFFLPLLAKEKNPVETSEIKEPSSETSKPNKEELNSPKQIELEKKNHQIYFQAATKNNLSFFSPPRIGLLLPGFDMLSLNRPGWAIFYGTLKLGGAALIYMAYTDQHYWQSLANSAITVQKQEPLELFFYDPKDRDTKYTARDLQNKADAGYLNIAFAVLFEVAVYTINYLHSSHLIRSANPNLEPFFKIARKEQDSALGARDFEQINYAGLVWNF